jgi:hypothetical protein
VVKVSIAVDAIVAIQAQLPKIKQVSVSKGWIEGAMTIDAGLRIKSRKALGVAVGAGKGNTFCASLVPS